MATNRPPVPAGLRDPGAELWREILGDLDVGWELDSRELHLLVRACRCADELAELEAVIDRDGVTVIGSRNQTVTHPAITEARQLRLAQARLLSLIELVDPKQPARSATPAQARARKAAEARWSRQRELKGGVAADG